MKIKTYYIFILAIFLSKECFTQNRFENQYTELILKARSFYIKNELDSSFSNYMQSYKICSNISFDLYNGACVAARIGKYNKALELLNKSIENGFIDRESLEKDNDLTSLHKLPEWENIISKIELEKSLTTTSEEVFKKISDLILTKEYKKILEYCSSDLKAKFPEDKLIKELEAVCSLLTAGIQEKDAMSWLNDDLVEINKFKYVASLSFFGYPFAQYFSYNKVGISITLDFRRINKIWHLNNLEIDKNNLNITDAADKIKNFLSKNDSVLINYNIVNIENNFNKSIKVSNSIFSNLRINKTETNNDIINKKSKNIYCLLIKSNKSFLDAWGNNALYIFEIAFPEESTDYCLIALENKYGLFEINKIPELKKIIDKYRPK